MHTTLYLLRHAATEANLAQPARLQGRRNDPPLAPLGLRQAAATRDFFAGRPLDVCFCSPLRRAVQTATIIAGPHGLTPQPLDDLIECDIGAWEGLDWATIRARHPDAYHLSMTDPTTFAYPDGESFAAVHGRAAAILDRLLRDHVGQTLLVVSHHIVLRTYLAVALGLPLRLARQVVLENCGISVVTGEGGKTAVTTLNAAFHLDGIVEPRT